MTQSKRRQFWRSKKGNVLVVMALSLVPLMLAAGSAFDLSRAVATKKHAQRAADMAALAGIHFVRDYSTYLDVMIASDAAFEENSPSNGTEITCQRGYIFWLGVERLEARIACQVPTLFGVSISGKSYMEVTANATAAQQTLSSDMALVLDLSGSMDTGKRRALKIAANSLINTMITPTTENRISIVPYADGVNAGDYGLAALGRGDEVDGSMPKTCVRERMGSNAFTDAAPDTVADYVGPVITTGPHRLCPDLPILPLTETKSKLINHINAVSSGGYTNGHLGIAWGWYTVSPEWADIWPNGSKPESYTNPDHTKVLVVLTDGNFNAAMHMAILGSARAQAEALCTAAKARGVIIFTIAFDTPTGGSAEALMQACATSPAHFFDANDADELLAAFNTIATGFVGVGLTN